MAGSCWKKIAKNAEGWDIYSYQTLRHTLTHTNSLTHTHTQEKKRKWGKDVHSLTENNYLNVPINSHVVIPYCLRRFRVAAIVDGSQSDWYGDGLFLSL